MNPHALVSLTRWRLADLGLVVSRKRVAMRFEVGEMTKRCAADAELASIKVLRRLTRIIDSTCATNCRKDKFVEGCLRGVKSKPGDDEKIWWRCLYVGRLLSILKPVNNDAVVTNLKVQTEVRL